MGDNVTYLRPRRKIHHVTHLIRDRLLFERHGVSPFVSSVGVEFSVTMSRTA